MIVKLSNFSTLSQVIRYEFSSIFKCPTANTSYAILYSYSYAKTS